MLCHLTKRWVDVSKVMAGKSIPQEETTKTSPDVNKWVSRWVGERMSKCKVFSLGWFPPSWPYVCPRAMWPSTLGSKANTVLLHMEEQKGTRVSLKSALTRHVTLARLLSSKNVISCIHSFTQYLKHECCKHCFRYCEYPNRREYSVTELLCSGEDVTY